jgi:hypothetical protein
MDLWLIAFLFFLPLRRTAQVAACFAAELAEGTVRTCILFQHLRVHGYILQSLAGLRFGVRSAYDILA